MVADRIDRSPKEYVSISSLVALHNRRQPRHPFRDGGGEQQQQQSDQQQGEQQETGDVELQQ
jgi:hypothetical protein